MALQTLNPEAKTPVAEKSITVMLTGTASAEMYKCPLNRKFVGQLWTSDVNYYGQINGIALRSTQNEAEPLKIELRSGDTVQSSLTASEYTMLHGVESDV